MSGSSFFRTGRIDTRTLDASDREHAWRLAAASGFEVSDLSPNVLAEGRLLQMGTVSFTDSSHPRQTFVRDARMIRHDGADAIVCSMELNPGSRIYMNGNLLGGGVGEVTFSDMARPTTKAGAAGRTLCVHIQRDALQTYMKNPESLITNTNNGFRSLLADYLRLIQRNQLQITAMTAGHLERSFLELIAACAAAPEAREQAQGAIDHLILARVLATIDDLLADPDLTPDIISQHMKISRSTLYRILSEAGGVSATVKERRLLRAHELLKKGGQPAIQAIAFSTGFRSVAQFSRAYRQRFGTTPSDTRSQIDEWVEPGPQHRFAGRG